MKPEPGLRVGPSIEEMPMTDPTSTDADEREIDEIPHDECIELLARSSVGRIAVVEGEQPLILPVNYTYTDDGIILHTDPGVKLEAGKQRLVAFEVDEIHPEEKTGWSVLVQGHAYDVTDTIDERSERLRDVAVDTWAPGPHARRMVVGLTTITGRRLRRGDAGEGG
jgi:nitroimidazol reductase NimA-like FMN-containing flavoprotein (pyridoxamine 5'-phosphate oxidase superfamily)